MFLVLKLFSRGRWSFVWNEKNTTGNSLASLVPQGNHYDKLLPFISFLKLLRILTDSSTDSTKILVYNFSMQSCVLVCYGSVCAKLKYEHALNK